MNVNALRLIALLLANIVLLAHTVLPHHYHETGICFMLHCNDSKEAHTHDDYDWHTHEGNPYAENCYIDDVYKVTTGGVKTTCKTTCYTGVKCGCKLVLFPLILDYLSINYAIDVTQIPFEFKPCVLSYYTEFIVGVLGLRAPPLC